MSQRVCNSSTRMRSVLCFPIGRSPFLDKKSFTVIARRTKNSFRPNSLSFSDSVWWGVFPLLCIPGKSRAHKTIWTINSSTVKLHPVMAFRATSKSKQYKDNFNVDLSVVDVYFKKTKMSRDIFNYTTKFSTLFTSCALWLPETLLVRERRISKVTDRAKN